MSSDFLSKERFEALRIKRGVSWGRPLRVHDSTPSTNDLALEAALGDMKTGGVFVAREQTAGRGRRGNAWQSPPGENLTFTALVRYPGAPQIAQPYSLVVGLAVRAAVALRFADSGDRVRVKWPNDVYFDDRKLSGILIESRIGADDVALAVGVGVNVLTRDFGPFAGERTSLALALDVNKSMTEGANPELEKESLLVDILRELEDRTRLFIGAGLEPLLAELERYDLLRGRSLSVDGAPGVGAGIDSEGRLLFQPDGAGPVVPIEAGTILLFRGPRPITSD